MIHTTKLLHQVKCYIFETYVVEDDSDYDSTPVHPPNDEYVSEDELEPSCTDSDSGSDSSS